MGPGQIASAFARALHRHTDQRVVAVGSRSIERADAFASQNSVQRSYGSYSELANDPGVDVVYVATPNSEHAALAELAMLAGKHVLIEKPMGVDAADVSRITEVARLTGRFAMEAMWSRYLPQTDVMRQLLDDGVLGDIGLVSADFGEDFGLDYSMPVFHPHLGGGAIRDIGIYPVWFAHFVLDAPLSVHAVGRLTETGVDGEVAALLGHKTGARSMLHSNLFFETPTVASVSGSSGRIEVDRIFLMPGGFSLTTSTGEQRWDDPYEPRGLDGLAWESVAVAQHIEDGLIESPLHPLSTTMQITETLDELRRQVTPGHD